jgi:4-hydroxybenzoate polyprenyltransferase
MQRALRQPDLITPETNLTHWLRGRWRAASGAGQMIKALRVSMACLAVGLAVTAYRLERLPLSLSTLAAVFCITCATMLQNDWRDRYHDIKKGKSFASDHPRIFLLFLLSVWCACCLSVGVIALQNGTLALLLAAMALAGLVYSETRKIPWTPVFLTAVTSASPALLPATVAADAAPALRLFAAAALLIFGREILKDLADKPFDDGHKWTIPLAYGNRTAKWLAIVSVIGGCLVAALISPLAIAGILPAGMGAVLSRRNLSLATAKRWLDVGTALALLVLAGFPP